MPRNLAWTLVVALLHVVLLGPVCVAAAAQGGAYTIRIEGPLDETLSQRLTEVSTLRSREGGGAVTAARLRSRAEDDLERFRAVLRSQGYYGGRLRYRIERGEITPEVVFEIEPGARYRLERFEVSFAGPADAEARSRVERLTQDLEGGGPARAGPIVEAEENLEADLRARGFPFAEIRQRSAVVDHAARTLSVRLTLALGPRARFGEPRIEGDPGIKEVFVRRRLAWKPGDPWDSARIEASRRNLVETGLFASVRIRHAGSALPDGSLPILVHLERARRRSVGAGLRYSSTDGKGFTLFWEHRNLLGGAERMRVAATLSDLEQSGTAAFREPDFLSPGQVLLVDAGYVREDTDAFLSRRFKTKASVERRLSKTVSARVGLGLERSSVEETDQPSEDFLLIGVPVQLRRDAADDLLDPTRGSRQELTVVPYLRGLGSDVEFYSARLTDASYLPVDDRGRAVLALRASLGSISGAGLSVVPADKRLYAGGGGSVRGYGFQLVGPLDGDGDPTGGLSLLEAGAELRLRVSDGWGVVPFVEGGNVFDESLPDFSDSLLWGAGIGLRWFSPVGPVRWDVAFPLNRRTGVDDAFQLYVSLGQSF